LLPAYHYQKAEQTLCAAVNFSHPPCNNNIINKNNKKEKKQEEKR
jgi:hypothetical protein